MRKAEEGTFLQLLDLLVREADAVKPTELTKREFTAENLTETKHLLARYQKKKLSVRQSDVAGATNRKTLENALRANAKLILKMRRQLRVYKGSATKNAVWIRFQGYTKVVERGAGGTRQDVPPTVKSELPTDAQKQQRLPAQADAVAFCPKGLVAQDGQIRRSSLARNVCANQSVERIFQHVDTDKSIGFTERLVAARANNPEQKAPQEQPAYPVSENGG